MTFKRLAAASALFSMLVLVPAAFGQDVGGGSAAGACASYHTSASAKSGGSAGVGAPGVDSEPSLMRCMRTSSSCHAGRGSTSAGGSR